MSADRPAQDPAGRGSVVYPLVLVALFFTVPENAKPVTLMFTVFVVGGATQAVGLRFDLLAFIAAMVPFGWLLSSPWILDVRAWYAAGPNLGAALMLALTGYAAYTAAGGRLLGARAERRKRPDADFKRRRSAVKR